ncbi:MAG: DUF1659 domain-containing protein [Dehalobacter sp. 4CP]|jgi:hypothetical protein|uniref:DUF1659 domain-containing protein n=2 Tax=Dehalobacter restrictus TaxID=55583 RepID=A0A857DER9_9FIRM|nr:MULTISPECIES: DUF1659 domain-containing protein [Dehalobacter]NBJ16617.1 DUF1659 domain-containing protein [Dehalobacter sp. 4CP]AHF08860.1 hypothetical protein DEHRE_00845 [Dehalobacter restrictus DSM 9455]MCG1024119.1 DUF1659 domain-containing protein [Dehalobacter sp.]MCM1566189.1 DUF1659 domain-containing protein [Dehalobacter sp.]MDJ0305439.1 DUF1659 domain-containing protein [Dehalobacter sp.]
MPVTMIPLSSVLAGRYQIGTTPAGGPILRKKGLNYVKPDATEQALYDVISALYSLSQHELQDILLQKNYRLEFEEG